MEAWALIRVPSYLHSLNEHHPSPKMRCLDWSIFRVPAPRQTLSRINSLQGPNFTDRHREIVNAGEPWKPPAFSIILAPTRDLEMPLEEAQVPGQGTRPDSALKGTSTRKGNIWATSIHSSLRLLLKKATLLHLRFKAFRIISF